MTAQISEYFQRIYIRNRKMALEIQNQIYMIIGIFGGVTFYLFIHLLILHTQFVNFRKKVKEGNVSANNYAGIVQQAPPQAQKPQAQQPQVQQSYMSQKPVNQTDVENNNSASILAARGYSSYTGKPVNSNAQLSRSETGGGYDNSHSNSGFYNQNQQAQLSSASPSNNRSGGGYDNTGFYNQQQPQQQQRWGRNPMSSSDVPPPSAQNQQQRQQNRRGPQNEIFDEMKNEMFDAAADHLKDAGMNALASGEFMPEGIPTDMMGDLGGAALKGGAKGLFGKFGKKK